MLLKDGEQLAQSGALQPIAGDWQISAAQSLTAFVRQANIIQASKSWKNKPVRHRASEKIDGTRETSNNE